MPVVVNWRNEDNTVIHMEITEPWSMPELSQGIQQSHSMMRSVSHRVDLIMDAYVNSVLPNNTLSHFFTRKADTIVPSNQQFVILVARNPFIRSFAAVAKRSLHRVTQNMHVVGSLEAGEAKLAELHQMESVFTAP